MTGFDEEELLEKRSDSLFIVVDPDQHSPNQFSPGQHPPGQHPPGQHLNGELEKDSFSLV